MGIEWLAQGEWITENSSKKKIEIEKCERTKKKLHQLIIKYRIGQMYTLKKSIKTQKIAYQLAEVLYKQYKVDNKKDGLTLHEIEVLNRFWE